MKAQSTSTMKATAYHEAGHAVADWRHGFKLKRATIVPKGDSAGSVSSTLRLHFRRLEYSNPSGATIGRYHERIVSLLAGRTAQRHFKPQSVRSWHASSDLHAATDLLCRLHGYGKEATRAFEYLEVRARNLVTQRHNWRMIQDLARTLMQRQTMTGPEIEATLRASMTSQTLPHSPPGRARRRA